MSNAADSNQYEILHAQYASREMTDGVIELDRMALDACYHVSADDDHALFSMNRESGLIVREKETGMVVGYSMLLPLTGLAYETIRRGRFIDTALSPSMVVRYDRPGIYDLYFASVIIHPDHRGVRLILQMLDAMVLDFIDLANRGIYIRRMLADVVSDGGEKFCRLFGLRKVCETDHNSKLYEVSGLPPMMRVTTPSTRLLFETYNAKYMAEMAAEGHPLVNEVDEIFAEPKEKA